MNNHLLFVYGSLKKGEIFHEGYLSTAQFLGKYKTKGALLDIGNFPGFVRIGDGYVYGELYSITTDDLMSIDMLEAEGFMYRRVKVSLTNVASTELAEAFAYELMSPGVYRTAKRLKDGVWSKGS